MATIIVTSTANSGAGSLRDAVASASNGDTITFDAGSGTIMLSSEIVIDKTITIDGDSDGDNKADFEISGTNNNRIFRIAGNSAADVVLKSLTIKDGATAAAGGAISITNANSVTIIHSTIKDSTSALNGGGILVTEADFYLINSTVSGNTSSLGGGGIVTASDVTTFILNSTIADNTSSQQAGGIVLLGDAEIHNSTIAGNHTAANNGGGGILADAAHDINVYNTVVAGNTYGASFDPGDLEASGRINIAEHSYFEKGGTITTFNPSDTTNGGAPALLSGLADNGGSVKTMGILTGSPLIATGNPTLLTKDSFDLDDDGEVSEALPVDATGAPRVQSGLDIGATEFTGNVVVTSFADGDDGDYSSGELTLREAISLVATGGTITFDRSIIGNTIVLSSQLVISRSMTIDGNISDSSNFTVAISGAGTSRIFNMNNTGDIVLKNLVLRDGDSARGGAIYANNIDSLTIIDSQLHDNIAADEGGAISLRLGSIDFNLINTSVYQNSAGDDGGGIDASDTTTSLIVNSLIRDNDTTDAGGGLNLHAGDATIYNSTIVANDSETGGGGIFGSETEIFNTVVAENTNGPSDDANDILGSGGFKAATRSFIGTAATITTQSDNNVNGGGDPLLDDPNSPLINAGNTAHLPSDEFDLDGDGNTSEDLSTDLFGLMRVLGDGLDIGATESRHVVVVDTLEDVSDGDLSAGNLSLREAITWVEIGGTIVFDASLAGGTIMLGSSLSAVKSFTIDGDITGGGKADITISGQGQTRIFNVNSPDFTIKSLNLVDGSADRGAAIATNTAAKVTIVNSTLENNNATSGDGGAIYFEGSGELVLANSTVNNNFATGRGGGIFTGVNTHFEAVNATIANNNSFTFGGGVHALGTLHFVSSTIAGNHTYSDDAGSGGLYASNVDTEILTTVIANNTKGSSPIQSDVPIGLEQASFSYIQTATTLGTNIQSVNGGADVKLGVLADNGGTVLTMALLEGSPLIDGTTTISSGPVVDFFDIDGDGNIIENLPTDARGQARITGASLDIGAVEKIANEANSIIRGDNDSNNPIGDAANNTIYGYAGDDYIYGYDGDDKLYGGADDDSLYGGNGDDKLYGGDNDDKLRGADGEDRLYGDDGEDSLDGGDDDDKLYGGNDDDELNGDDGDDKLYGGDGDDELDGGDGEDRLYGDDGDDELDGGGDDDKLYGGDGDDELDGGFGDDKLYGNDGKDELSGDQGEDELYGGNGNDELYDGQGDDKLYGGDGNDKLYGGDDNDRLDGGAGNDKLYGEDGKDNLYGRDGNDKLDGGDGNDDLKGHDGNDKLYGRGGKDKLDGGDGNDKLYGHEKADKLYGKDGNDKLDGGDGNDKLYGGDDNDKLYGKDGNDTLYAGKGNDKYYGGDGRDTFHFDRGDDKDIIKDFEDNRDTIELDRFNFSNVADALSNAVQDGNDVVFNFGNGDRLTVEDVTIAQLSNDIDLV